MPSSIGSDSVSDEVAEVFKVSMCPKRIRGFLESRKHVHEFLGSIQGYLGLDILILSDSELIVLIRWKSYELFDANLSLILNGQPVTHWMKNAAAISHQPAIIKTIL